MPLSSGQILNKRYQIVSLLVQGGYGAVYRAWDVKLNIAVALKENINTTPNAARQFQAESRLLAGLRHANLPYMIDHFIIPDQGQYLVMEFIDGQDLREMLNNADCGLPESQVLRWMEDICDALIYLHAQSPPVIHRDIKPANIIITPQGEAKLVDFGIAKQFGAAYPGNGGTTVTMGYSPPEQYGESIPDERSDIYAFGATLYALLTGVVPEESLERRAGKTLRPPRQIKSAISPPMEHVILRAMRLDPNRRYQRFADLKTDLLAVAMNAGRASGPVYAENADFGADSAQAAVTKSRSGRWIGLGVIAFVLACILVVVVGVIGYTMLMPGLGNATATRLRLSLAQTGTALAIFVQQTPTPSPQPPTTTMTILVPTTAEMLDTLTPSPTISPSPTELAATATIEYEYWQACSGTYLSRLHIGDRAFVSTDPPLPNRVRSEPDTDSNILGYLQVGENMEILDGPECEGGWVWWYVQSLDTTMLGWTAEGDDTNYWLIPLP